MAKHAELSASGAKRWRNCPGSVHRSKGQPNIASRYAMEGTAAHALQQHCLEGRFRNLDNYLNWVIFVHRVTGDTQMIPEGAVVPSTINEAEWEKFEVDGEMIEALSLSLAAIDAAIEEAGKYAKVMTEHYYDLSKIDPRLGGTGDCTILVPYGWAHLFDLKFGRGVTVEVVDNDQLKVYALGVILENPDCEGVKVSIVQPRRGHDEGPVRSESYTAAELEAFAVELKRDADRTDDPAAPLKAGDWCTFCPAKAGCPALGAKAAELAKADFAEDPPDMAQFEDKASQAAKAATGAEIGRVLSWVPVLEAFARATRAEAQRRLEDGADVEGFKLVRGRAGNRVWRFGEDRVASEIENAGYHRAEAYSEPALKSPAQMEKLGAKAKRAVSGLTSRPEGSLTVAAVEDPRPAVSVSGQAAIDFAEEDEGVDPLS